MSTDDWNLMKVGGFNIMLTEDFTKIDHYILKCFSEVDLPEHPGIFRRYIRDASERVECKNGTSKWRYYMLHWYEIKIPKEMLEIDVEKTKCEFTAFKVKQTGETLINKATGKEVKDSFINFQNKYINCPSIHKKRDLEKFLKIAHKNEKTIYEADEPVCFKGDYLEVMFLSKYANGKTNYNKYSRNYNRLKVGDGVLINFILRNGVENAEKIIEEAIEKNENCDYPNKPERIDFLKEMLADVQRWTLEKEMSADWKTIPQEFFETFRDLKNWRHS